MILNYIIFYYLYLTVAGLQSSHREYSYKHMPFSLTIATDMIYHVVCISMCSICHDGFNCTKLYGMIYFISTLRIEM